MDNIIQPTSTLTFGQDQSNDWTPPRQKNKRNKTRKKGNTTTKSDRFGHRSSVHWSLIVSMYVFIRCKVKSQASAYRGGQPKRKKKEERISSHPSSQGGSSGSGGYCREKRKILPIRHDQRTRHHGTRDGPEANNLFSVLYLFSFPFFPICLWLIAFYTWETSKHSTAQHVKPLFRIL